MSLDCFKSQEKLITIGLNYVATWRASIRLLLAFIMVAHFEIYSGPKCHHMCDYHRSR